MKFNARQWLIYFAAWIPYAFSYVAVFLVQGTAPAQAFLTMLLNIVPALTLGIAVVYLCLKFIWKYHRRWYFFPSHILFALVYSFGWYLLAVLFLTLDMFWQSGIWSPAWLTSFAFQWLIFSGLMIYATIACIVYVLQIAQNLRVEEQRAARAETLYAQTQLSALRAQLNPHFLFNTLHSLMALTRYEPAKAEIALEKLAEMLRYVLQEKREDSPHLILLEEEWDFVSNYLALEKLRFGERLKVKNEIGTDALSCLLPAFTLQPLVENAVKHGISPQQRGGEIIISAIKAEKDLILRVSNGYAPSNNGQIAPSNGLGLKLLRQQLETVYAGRAELIIDESPENQFSVEITLPIEITSAGKTEK